MYIPLCVCVCVCVCVCECYIYIYSRISEYKGYLEESNNLPSFNLIYYVPKHVILQKG